MTATSDSDERDELNAESKEDLVELYHNQRLSIQEVADTIGCNKSKVRYWMNKHDLERRSRAEAKLTSGGPPSMSVDSNGYENFIVSQGGDKSRIDVHRLLAISEHGADDVANSHVHHKNGIPWDNRPENLEVLSIKDHVSEHHGTDEYVKLAAWALYESTELTYREIGERLDESTTNIGSYIKYVRDGNATAPIEVQ